MAYEEMPAENFTNNNFFTGGLRKRLVLVLDCVTPHDFEYALFVHTTDDCERFFISDDLLLKFISVQSRRPSSIYSSI